MPSQTFSIATGVDDQLAFSSASATYPPATSPANWSATGAFCRARRGFTPSVYNLENALLRFDTSALPDSATVTAATLRVFVSSKSDVNSLSLTAGWYVWNGSSNSDLTSTPETNALAGTTIASIATSSDNDFVLSNAAANVSKTSMTYLRLHISQRSSDAAPSGENYVTFDSLEATGSNEPRLIVTYDSGVSYIVGAVHV